MKKNILFLIVSVFAVTMKASEDNKALKNNVLYTIQPIASNMGGQTRGNHQPLEEREKLHLVPIQHKNIQLSILNSTEQPTFKDPNNIVHVIRFKQDSKSPKIMMQVELVHQSLGPSAAAWLGANFNVEGGFIQHLEQEAKKGTVYFKLSFFDPHLNELKEFYFSKSSKEIISDFGLKQLKSKITEISETNEPSRFLWIKYAAIPFGLLAILSVWYLKYKR